MGITGSKAADTGDGISSEEQGSSEEAAWAYVSTGPREQLTYDASTSRALLCTVRKFQHDLFLDSGIPVPAGHQHSDAQKLSTWWTSEDGGGLPDPCSIVLDEDSHAFLGFTPTKNTIQDLLKECVESVGKGGLLFFYFSGHARRSRDGKVYLLPTDYDSIVSHGISSADISAILQHANPDSVIALVFDCCEADGLAKQILENETFGRCPASVYLAFACGGSESAIHHSQLGGGVFSFFLLEYLKHQQPVSPVQRHFDLAPALKFCRPLYAACSWLSQFPAAAPFADADNGSGPRFLFQDATVERYLHASSDAVDGAEENPYRFLTQFLRYTPGAVGKEMILQPPRQLVAWLRTTSAPALHQLYETGFISSDQHPALFKTIASMLAVSCARGVTIHNRHRCLERNLFIVTMVHVMEVFHAVSETLVSDCWNQRHMALALRYYMAALRTMHVSLAVEELKGLIELLVEMQSEDTVDGQLPDAEALFNSLPKCQLSQLPQETVLPP